MGVVGVSLSPHWRQKEAVATADFPLYAVDERVLCAQSLFRDRSCPIIDEMSGLGKL